MALIVHPHQEKVFLHETRFVPHSYHWDREFLSILKLRITNWENLYLGKIIHYMVPRLYEETV